MRKVTLVVGVAIALAASGAAVSRAERPATPGGPVPKGFVGTSLSFISSGYGWVLGSAPCAKAPCTSLLRTTDGGRSWHGIPAPRTPISSDGTNGDVSSIRFANAEDGFAFDPGLWTTSNGGHTWLRTPAVVGLKRFVVQSLAATSNGTVYALVAKQDVASDTPSLTLVRAASHSTTFSTVATIPHAGRGVLTAAGSSVYVTSGDVVLNHLESFGPTGHRSTELPDPRDGCTLAASSSTSLLAICSSSVATGGMGDREAYGTTDGGRHWTRLPNPGEGDGYNTEAIAETSNGHAVVDTAQASGSGLLSTADDARSWRLSLSRTGRNAGTFTDLGFETNAIGSVILDPFTGPGTKPRPTGQLLRTDNGGVSWHRETY